MALVIGDRVTISVLNNRPGRVLTTQGFGGAPPYSVRYEVSDATGVAYSDTAIYFDDELTLVPPPPPPGG